MTILVETTMRNMEKYPYLGITEKGKIVLFTHPKTGTELCPPFNHLSCWDEDKYFRPYAGMVTLSNISIKE